MKLEDALLSKDYNHQGVMHIYVKIYKKYCHRTVNILVGLYSIDIVSYLLVLFFDITGYLYKIPKCKRNVLVFLEYTFVCLDYVLCYLCSLLIYLIHYPHKIAILYIISVRLLDA